jgi:hypothetical protein
MARPILIGFLAVAVAAVLGAASPQQADSILARQRALCRSVDGRSYTSVGAPVDGSRADGSGPGAAGSACTTPYADAGKVCSDRRDCRGYCEIDRDKYPKPKTSDLVTGKCQVMQFPLGEHDVVEQGHMKHLDVME